MSEETDLNGTAIQPLTLSNQEFMALAGLSKSQFYDLKKDGWFDGLESGLPRRWSRMKVLDRLRGGTFRPPRRKRVA